jgi:molecular chaperone GrpE
MPKSSDTMNDVEEEVPVRRVRPKSAGGDVQAESRDAAAAEADPSSSSTQAAVTQEPVLASDDAQAIARERDDYYDRLLRKTAEFDNYRKRVERERREQADYAAADVLTDLLPLIDDLERALLVDSQPGGDAYRKGVELIHRQMLDLLRRRGVTPVEAVGQPFDPHLHQAVSHEVVPGHAEGEVVEEFRRGYKLRDRLLRPAMVKVAKA